METEGCAFKRFYNQANRARYLGSPPQSDSITFGDKTRVVLFVGWEETVGTSDPGSRAGLLMKVNNTL